MLFNFVSKKDLLINLTELQRTVAKQEMRIIRLEMMEEEAKNTRKPVKPETKSESGYVSRYKVRVAVKSDLAKGHIVLKDTTEIGIDSKIAAKLSKGFTLKDKHATKTGWIAKMNPKA